MNLKEMSNEELIDKIKSGDDVWRMAITNELTKSTEYKEFRLAEAELLRRFAELEQKVEEGQKAIKAMQKIKEIVLWPTDDLTPPYRSLPPVDILGKVEQVIKDYQLAKEEIKQGKQKEND